MEIRQKRECDCDILHRQIAAGQKTERIRKVGEAIRQEVSELSVTNLLLKEQTETLIEDKEKPLSENEELSGGSEGAVGAHERTLQREE